MDTEEKAKLEYICKILLLNDVSPEPVRRLMNQVGYLAALDEWHKKTEWVQETAQSGELGMHRADVLRKRIEEAEEKYALLRVTAESHARDHKRMKFLMNPIFPAGRPLKSGDVSLCVFSRTSEEVKWNPIRGTLSLDMAIEEAEKGGATF